MKLGGFPVLLLDKIHTMWKSSQKELSDVVWAFSLPRAWRGKLKSENEDRMVDFFSYFKGGSGVHTAEQDECDISVNQIWKTVAMSNHLYLWQTACRA